MAPVVFPSRRELLSMSSSLLLVVRVTKKSDNELVDEYRAIECVDFIALLVLRIAHPAMKRHRCSRHGLVARFDTNSVTSRINVPLANPSS